MRNKNEGSAFPCCQSVGSRQDRLHEAARRKKRKKGEKQKKRNYNKLIPGKSGREERIRKKAGRLNREIYCVSRAINRLMRRTRAIGLAR